MTFAQNFVPPSYQEFDHYLAELIGLYLGGVITAEELRHRSMRARSNGIDARIFPWPRPNQDWHYDDGQQTTPESIVQGDLEFFAPDYTNGPAPERVGNYDPGEYPEEGLRQRILQDWIPQLEANYGTGFVQIRTPDQDYLDRRSVLAAELADVHRRYLDGRLSGSDFADAVMVGFSRHREAEDVHHYQFEAANWDAAMLEHAVINADRDQFTYDGRGPARRRLHAIEDAFPELR